MVLDYILDSDTHIDELLERKKPDLRREFIREHAIDLSEKSKQAHKHLKKLRRLTMMYKLTGFKQLHLSPTLRGSITTITDSYEAIVSKIKGINDNLNSLVAACYASDEYLETAAKRFMRKPELARQLSAKMVQEKGFAKKLPVARLSKTQTLPLAELLAQMNIDNKKIFDYHRNITQHAKTSQSLELSRTKITVPACFVPEYISKGEDAPVPLAKFLTSALDYTIKTANAVIEAIAQDDSNTVFTPRRYDADSLHDKHVMDKFKMRAIPKVLMAIGLAASIYYPLKHVSNLKAQSSSWEKFAHVQAEKGILSLAPYVTGDNQNMFMSVRKKQIMDKEDAKLTAELFDFIGDSLKHEYLSTLHQLSNSYYLPADTVMDFVDKFGTYVREPYKTSKVLRKNQIPYLALDAKLRDIDFLFNKKLDMDRLVARTIANKSDEWFYDDVLVEDVIMAMVLTNHSPEWTLTGYNPIPSYEEKLTSILRKNENNLSFHLQKDFEAGIDFLAEQLVGDLGKDKFLYYLYNHTPFYQDVRRQIPENYDEYEQKIAIDETSSHLYSLYGRMVTFMADEDASYPPTLSMRIFANYPSHKVKLPIHSWDGRDLTFVKQAPEHVLNKNAPLHRIERYIEKIE